MPSQYSSEHSVSDAEDLAKRQGLHARTVPIAADGRRVPGRAEPGGTGRGEPPVPDPRRDPDGAVQRRRATWSSPPATRASSPPGTPPSTATRPAASTRSRTCSRRWSGSWPGGGTRQAVERGETPPIPENSITKPPSAELAPGQLDSDSLPDYAVLDAMLDDYVEKDMGAAALIAAGHDPGPGRPGDPAGGPGRVQAAAVPAGPEDHPAQLRPRPAPADHQPLARAPPGPASRLQSCR